MNKFAYEGIYATHLICQYPMLDTVNNEPKILLTVHKTKYIVGKQRE